MSQYTVWYYVSSSRENGVDKILTIKPFSPCRRGGQKSRKWFQLKRPRGVMVYIWGCHKRIWYTGSNRSSMIYNSSGNNGNACHSKVHLPLCFTVFLIYCVAISY